jgi:hypothetical protein
LADGPLAWQVPDLLLNPDSKASAIVEAGTTPKKRRELRFESISDPS